LKHDLNNSPSYEHLMGTEMKAHMGSQSHLGNEGPPSHYHSIGQTAGTVTGTGAREQDPPDYDEKSVAGKSKMGKKLPEKSPTGLDYSDE
jgi:hypothetical protein